MMVEADNMRIMQVLADATNVIAEGEVLQLMNMHDASLDEADYLQSSARRRPSCSKPARGWARSWPASGQAIEEACATYGQALGTAFQVIDDVLDYAGTAAEMGKNLGDDLREGKATLP
jgi:octaprenyl-diphosphate synthase